MVTTSLIEETSGETALARFWPITSTKESTVTGRRTAYKLIPGTRGESQPSSAAH